MKRDAMDKPQLDPIVGELLKIMKERRLKLGLSHQQLADKAGVNRSTISLLESQQRNPTVQLAARVAEAMDCKLSELLKLAEKKARA